MPEASARTRDAHQAVVLRPPQGRENARLIVGRCARPTRTALNLRPALAFDEWSELGLRITRVSSAAAWWIADWIVYGRYQYGRRYKTAIAATGLDYQTLRNYAAVARRFPPERRRSTLSFHHHAELIPLPDDLQEAWLDRAEEQSWSRNQLRRELRLARPGRGPRDLLVVTVAASPEQCELWRSAAAVMQAALETWAASALDEAALHVVRQRRVGAS